MSAMARCGARRASWIITAIATALVSAPASPAEGPSDSPPVLTLDHAIQLAIANNRSLRIASLDVDKSSWQVAEAKTRRFPSIKTFMFASGDLTSPAFTFKAGTFGTVLGVPVPAQ